MRPGSGTRAGRLPAALVLACSLALPAVGVLAEPAAHRIVVHPFQGPKGEAARVRGAVLEVLSRAGDLELVVGDDVAFKARMIGADLQTEKGRARVAVELGIDTWVEGVVEGEDDDWEAEVRVVEVTGDEVAEAEFEASSVAGLQLAIRDKLWDRIATRVSPAARQAVIDRQRAEEQKARAAAEAEQRRQAAAEQRQARARAAEARRAAHAEQRAEQREAARGSSRAGEPSDAGYGDAAGVGDDFETSPLLVGLRLRPVSRNFDYSGSTTARRDYEHGLASQIELDGRWYPYASAGSVEGHLGMEARARIPLGMMRSKGLSGEELETDTMLLSLGMRGRIPAGAHEVGITGGVAYHTFSLERPEADPVAVPDAAYVLGRLAVDAAFELDPGITLGVGAGYLYPFSFGELGSERWFPNVSGHGMEAQVLAGYWLADTFQFQVGAGLRSYFLSLNQEPGDARYEADVDDGLGDLYLSLFAGFWGRLPG